MSTRKKHVLQLITGMNTAEIESQIQKLEEESRKLYDKYRESRDTRRTAKMESMTKEQREKLQPLVDALNAVCKKFGYSDQTFTIKFGRTPYTKMFVFVHNYSSMEETTEKKWSEPPTTKTEQKYLDERKRLDEEINKLEIKLHDMKASVSKLLKNNNLSKQELEAIEVLKKGLHERYENQVSQKS